MKLRHILIKHYSQDGNDTLKGMEFSVIKAAFFGIILYNKKVSNTP